MYDCFHYLHKEFLSLDAFLLFWYTKMNTKGSFLPDYYRNSEYIRNYRPALVVTNFVKYEVRASMCLYCVASVFTSHSYACYHTIVSR